MFALFAFSLAHALEPDLDGDGFTTSFDCDDTDAAVNPDADETCDGIDDDCDGLVDDDDDGVIDQGAYLVDADGDGLGVGLKKYFCTQPAGYCVAWAVRDCDDTDASIGMWTTWHPDEDGDGYGSSGGPLTCDAPSGYVTLGTDCDDGDPARNPTAVEVCNGLDDNCDGLTDDADPLLVAEPRYVDGDEDGYGEDTPVFDWGCAIPAGYVEIAGDCDDTSGWTHPGAPETCDGEDEDCDGAIDDDTVAVRWFVDADDDGHGVATDMVRACGQPRGYARAAGDCDDAEPTVFPDAPEYCYNGVDDNCDGGTDNCWLDAEEEVDFSFVGDEHYSYFGAALAIADVDADGNADLLVGAWNWDGGYGAAYVLSGPREFGTADLGDADQTFTSSYYWDGGFGSALAFGDANGDGAGDLLVGAPGILPSVSLFLGPTTAGADTADADAFFTPGELWFTQTGAAVDVIPDHDGDGVDDLLVGAPGRQLQRGVVFIVSGDVTGTHEIEDVASHRYRTGGLDGTGQSLAALDQDGDGLSDLLIGAPRAAAAFLLEGGVPSGSYAVTGLDDAQFLGNLGRDNFGWDVAAGDLDDDGYADAIVTAPSARTNAGATSGVVYAFLGPLSGTTYGMGADIRWEGSGGGGFGASVATGEDVDGDGETDTIIGDSNGYGGDVCTTYLQRGHTSGVVTADQLAAFQSSENDALGSAVAFVPDWNGDGLSEIASGAPLATDSGVTGGAVRVFWSQHFVE